VTRRLQSHRDSRRAVARSRRTTSRCATTSCLGLDNATISIGQGRLFQISGLIGQLVIEHNTGFSRSNCSFIWSDRPLTDHIVRNNNVGGGQYQIFSSAGQGKAAWDAEAGPGSVFLGNIVALFDGAGGYIPGNFFPARRAARRNGDGALARAGSGLSRLREAGRAPHPDALGRQWDTWSPVYGRYIDVRQFMTDAERKHRMRPVMDYLGYWYALTLSKMIENRRRSPSCRRRPIARTRCSPK
jgi:hypothetical protein